MITLSSLLHTAKSADSYAYDKETLHIRLKTRVNEIKEVSVWIGDPYQWEEGGLDGGNLGGGMPTVGVVVMRLVCLKKVKVIFMITGSSLISHLSDVHATVSFCMVPMGKSIIR